MKWFIQELLNSIECVGEGLKKILFSTEAIYAIYF